MSATSRAWTAGHILFFSCCVSAGAAGAAGSELTVPAGGIDFRFDSGSGRWLSAHETASGAALLTSGARIPQVTITHGGVTSVTTGRFHLWSILGANSTTIDGGGSRIAQDVSGGSTRVKIESMAGEWRVHQEFTLGGEAGSLERRVRLTWNGEGETLLRWVDLLTPIAGVEEWQTLQAPGYAGILRRNLTALPMGEWKPDDRADPDVPGRRPGLMILSRPGAQLLTWSFDRAIPSVATVHRSDWGVSFQHRFFASCRLRKGQAVTVGTQYFMLQKGDLRDGLAKMRKFWRKAGLERQDETPGWGRSPAIYEVHLGRFGSRAPYPDIQALTADLERIADLGFDVIQLMPRFPYPHYRVHDYLDIETHYAPEPALRAFIRRAHELGLKVLLDVVMHGVADRRNSPDGRFDRHPFLDQHPEWFSYTEDGRVAQTYTWAFDHASPSFVDYISQVFAEYIRRLDVDGFRVDAATWNLFPNWAAGLPRPGYLSFYGSVPMFERVRKEVRAIKPDTLFITETTGPLFATGFDLTYNYDELWTYGGLLPLRSESGWSVWRHKINARQLAEWLDLRDRVFPDRWQKVRQADSHDTWMRGRNRFVRDLLGIEGARLLFALCAFLDGGVMVWAGGEEGSEDFYRNILRARRDSSAMRGEIDYLALRPDNDRVFAPLWTQHGEWAIPVLSFSPKALETRLPLDALGLKPDVTYKLIERVSGSTRIATGAGLRHLSLELPAYGVQVWTISESEAAASGDQVRR
jgi:hypothetical protein